MIENLAARVQKGEQYDPTESFDFFKSTELNSMISTMKDKHPENYTALLTDGSIMGNMIHDRPKLGRLIHEEDVLLDVQKMIASGELKSEQEALIETQRRLDLFERKIEDDKNFARKYATLKLLDSGKAQPIDGRSYSVLSTAKSYLGTTDLIYDNDKRLNILTQFMDETVQYDRKNDKYSLSEDFLNAGDEKTIRAGIETFIKRSYLESNLNEANEETIQFLIDVNASKYYQNYSAEQIQASVVQKLFK